MKLNSKLIGFIAILLFSFSSFGIVECNSTKLSSLEISNLNKILTEKFEGKVVDFFQRGGVELKEGQYYDRVYLSIPLWQDYVANRFLDAKLNFQYKTKNGDFIRDYFWDEEGYHHQGSFGIEFKENIARDWDGHPIKKTCSLTISDSWGSEICFYNTSQDNHSLGCFKLFEEKEEVMSLDMNLPLVD